jgi:hypothetical protein
MTRTILIALRAVLALLFAASVACQVFSVALAGSVVGGTAISVLAALIIAGALCVEVVLLAVWMLVGLVQSDAIFDEHGRADRWVDAAIASLVAAAVFAAGGLVYFLVEHSAGRSPADLALALIAASAAGLSIALALLVVVMRRLLHTAIRLNSELAEVI